MMIELADRFSVSRDEQCWTLHEKYMGKATVRKGVQLEPKEQVKRTYHATLKQVANEVVDRMGGECKSMKELLAVIDDAEKVVASQLEAAAK
jgi:hypothetical protein